MSSLQLCASVDILFKVTFDHIVSVPEHLNDINAKPTEKSDVYSFGIVLWAIFAKKEPYESKTFIVT